LRKKVCRTCVIFGVIVILLWVGCGKTSKEVGIDTPDRLLEDFPTKDIVYERITEDITEDKDQKEKKEKPTKDEKGKDKKNK